MTIRPCGLRVERLTGLMTSTARNLPSSMISSAGESNNEKKLEPVKYTDEGEYYIVHRVLAPGEKRFFFLKLGDRVSEVRRVN